MRVTRYVWVMCKLCVSYVWVMCELCVRYVRVMWELCVSYVWVLCLSVVRECCVWLLCVSVVHECCAWVLLVSVACECSHNTISQHSNNTHTTITQRSHNTHTHTQHSHIFHTCFTQHTTLVGGGGGQLTSLCPKSIGLECRLPVGGWGKGGGTCPRGSVDEVAQSSLPPTRDTWGGWVARGGGRSWPSPPQLSSISRQDRGPAGERMGLPPTNTRT